MKTIILPVFFLLMSIHSFAQYREEYGEHELRYVQQSDSIYRVNKVKIRHSYKASGYPSKLQEQAEMMFDINGRITQIQYERYVNGQLRTIYYTYDSVGKLASVKDVFIKGKANPGYKELIGEEEFDKKIKEIPERAEYTYTLTYRGDMLTGLIAINEKGEKMRESNFSNNGLTHQYQAFKKVGHKSTTQYLDNSIYKFLPVDVVLAFDGSSANESRFEYRFDEKGLLVERIEYKKNYSPFSAQFQHNENGLLTSAREDYPEVFFEYEFYK